MESRRVFFVAQVLFNIITFLPADPESLKNAQQMRPES